MDTTLVLAWHDTVESLDAALAGASARPRHTLVSARLPLLADLTVAENIALPRAYHLNVNAPMARLQAREFAARLLPPPRANSYPDELSPAETFAALWLRAVSLPGQIIVLESPLSSFDLTETALKEYAARCHGLFVNAIAHECRAHTAWSSAT